METNNNNNNNRTFNLGYFLRLRHIKKAYKLLIKQIEDNHPLYNNLDFRIYRQEITELKELQCEEFYNKYIKNDCFYYYQSDFFLINYTGVQGAYKIRKYQFLSPKLLLVYYAIGIYIRETLNRYHHEIKKIFKQSSIETYYGGKVNLEDTSASTIYYYEDYKSFLDEREKLTKNEDGKIKYILSLDIKSFFYTVNHKILLKIIKEKAFSHDKEKNKYDSDTTTTIEFFLNYLTSNNSGLVVSAQNLISSYLSHVYLSLFDHFVVDNYVQKYDISYIRYVDDFYLIWSVPDTTEDEENRKFLYKIENELVEFLIGKLELEINPTKSRRNRIYTEQDFKKFIVEEKPPSPTDEYYDDYEEEETTNLSLPDEGEETILSKVINTLTKINENESIELSDETIDIIKASSLSEIQDRIQTNLPTKPKISIENEVGDFTTKKSIILSVEEREISIECILREIDNLINPVLVEISQNNELADKLKMDTQFLINVSQKLSFEKAISIISNLKLQLKSWERIRIEKKDENVLNKLILGTKNNGCRDYTHRPQAIQQISDAKLFHDLSSVEFLLIKPKPFLHLITINDTIRVAFENYLLENITNIDNQYKFLFLLERFILQLDFLKSQNRYRSKIELGKTINRFAEKITDVVNKQSDNSNSKVKYLRLINKMLDKDFNIKPASQNLYTNDFLNDNVSLMQQIKQRVFYEKFGHYNVAFNNLLNEFHELFKIVYDDLNKSKLEAKEIGEHMTKECFATDDVLFVLDFFNRRNKNSISHPNDADLGFWGVSKEEYIKYKERLEPILIKLMQRITE